MFRDRRDFRAIALHAPGMHSVESILKLLSPDSASSAERLVESTATLTLTHCLYYSSSVFPVNQEDLANLRKKGPLYEYNMYLMGYAAPGALLIVLAVPFPPMAWEVFERIHAASRGRNVQYAKVSLKKLVIAIREKRHLGGNIKMKSVDFLVYGDPAVRDLAINGKDSKDPLHSKTYDKLASAKGVRLAPRRCAFVFDDHEGRRFAIETDRLGNFSFHVARNAKNLPSSAKLWTYLYDERLVEDTPAFPLRKGAIEEDEDELSPS